MADSITVTWGEEHYQVANYSGFRVGPFSITTDVRPGETVAQAMTRANADLEAHAKKMFIAQRNAFIEKYPNRA